MGPLAKAIFQVGHQIPHLLHLVVASDRDGTCALPAYIAPVVCKQSNRVSGFLLRSCLLHHSYPLERVSVLKLTYLERGFVISNQVKVEP